MFRLSLGLWGKVSVGVKVKTELGILFEVYREEMKGK